MDGCIGNKLSVGQNLLAEVALWVIGHQEAFLLPALIKRKERRPRILNFKRRRREKELIFS